MSISWDLEAKELLRGGATLLNGVMILNGSTVVSSAGPNALISKEEAEIISERSKDGTLHKDIVRVNGKEYFITTVGKHTMYARGFGPGAGGLVICRFPQYLALLLSAPSKYLPTAYCETWTAGILSVLNAGL